jgi:hypothetical protein
MTISIWRQLLTGTCAKFQGLRRRNRDRAAGIESLESRQLLSATSLFIPAATEVAHDVQSKSQKPLVFWDSFSPIEVVEGNSGSKTFEIGISCSPSAPKDIKIKGTIGIAGTGDGFANVADFQIEKFSAVIKKGKYSTFVDVTVFGDIQVEPDEIFNATITSASGATIDANHKVARVKILNDDVAINPLFPKVSIQSGTFATAEGQTQTFTLQLDKVSLTDISVNVHLLGVSPAPGGNASATIPNDAQFAGGVAGQIVVIPAGTLTKTFDVTLVNDIFTEPNKDYAVAILTAVNATPAGNISQIGTILENNV